MELRTLPRSEDVVPQGEAEMPLRGVMPVS